MKALFTIRLVVTKWLSNGAACKRCIERYAYIKALDNVFSEKPQPEIEGVFCIKSQTIM